MLALDNDQLAKISLAAAGLPSEKRSTFLEREWRERRAASVLHFVLPYWAFPRPRVFAAASYSRPRPARSGRGRPERRVDVTFREPRPDVLRTIRVENFRVQQEETLGLAAVSRRHDFLGQRRVGGKLLRLNPRIYLESPPARMVHQKQRDAVVRRSIAQGDILPVAAKNRRKRVSCHQGCVMSAFDP